MDVRELNVNFETSVTSVALVQNKWTLIAGVDAGRWSIGFSIPNGAQPCPVSPQNVTVGLGWWLTTSSSGILFTAQQMPGGVAGNWYAFGVAIGQTISVFTTRDIRVPSETGG